MTTTLITKSTTIGKRLKLRCAIKGSPMPKIHWVRNGKVVERTSKFRPRKRLLVIRNYTKNEAGRYTCVGNNSHGRRNMTFIVETKEVAIQPATESSLPLVKEVIVRPGQNMTLSCQAPAGRTPKLLSWNNKYSRRRRQQDLALSKSARYFLQFKSEESDTYTQQYLLMNISKSVHEGDYKCIGLFNKEVITVKVVKLKVVEQTGEFYLLFFCQVSL